MLGQAVAQAAQTPQPLPLFWLLPAAEQNERKQRANQAENGHHSNDRKSDNQCGVAAAAAAARAWAVAAAGAASGSIYDCAGARAAVVAASKPQWRAGLVRDAGIWEQILRGWSLWTDTLRAAQLLHSRLICKGAKKLKQRGQPYFCNLHGRVQTDYSAEIGKHSRHDAVALAKLENSVIPEKQGSW